MWLEIHSKGTGTTSNHIIVWQNNSGNGSETQVQQQAVIRYYYDDLKQFLNVDSNFNNQAISVNDPAGNWINFGDEAATTFDNYQSENADSADTILDSDGNPASFAVTGIFPQFNNINNNTDGTDSHPQYFIVHFTHKKQAAESQSTTITEHVSYYYENGSKQGQTVPDQYAPINQELHFTRDGQTDLVTGVIAYGNWKLVDANGNAISLPAIPFSQLPQTLVGNYKLDANGTFIVNNNTGKPFLIIKGDNGSIPGISFNDDEITSLYNQNGGSITVQIPYIQTINPSTPKPTQPAQQPTLAPAPDPTTPVTPLPTVEPTATAQPTNATVLPDATPVQPFEIKRVNYKSSTNVAPHSQTQKHGHDYNYLSAPKATSTHIEKHAIQSKGQIKPVISKTTTNKQNTLPQTGENKSNLGIIGLGIAALAGLFGLDYDKNKRKN